MLLLELAQARLGKADARREGSGEEKGEEMEESRGWGERGRSSRTLSDAFFAGVGPDFVGGGSCLLMMSHLHGYGLWLVP